VAIKDSKEPIELFGACRICFENFKAILVYFRNQYFLKWSIILITRRWHYLLKHHAASANCTILKKLKRLCKSWDTHACSSSSNRHNSLFRAALWIWIFGWIYNSASFIALIFIDLYCCLLLILCLVSICIVQFDWRWMSHLIFLAFFPW